MQTQKECQECHVIIVESLFVLIVYVTTLILILQVAVLFAVQGVITKQKSLSLLVAISGGAKSIIMRYVESTLLSDEVKQAFSVARGSWCKELAKLNWYS